MVNLQYACSAARLDDKATRCTVYVNFAAGWPEKPEEVLCTFHKNRKDAGERVITAPAVDVLLLRFFLNRDWDETFREAGVPFLQKNLDTTMRIEAVARRLGRNPYRYNRDLPDSGVPVFGKSKEGLRGAALDGLLFELITEAGYNPFTCWRSLKPKGDTWLTVGLSLFANGERDEVPVEALALLYSFMGAAFDHTHIWSNPLQPPNYLVTTGTLNAAGRNPDVLKREDKERPRLRFANGLWTVR